MRSAPQLAEQLDGLLDPLAAAAELCGAPSTLMDMTFDPALIKLPLTVDLSGQHRRRLYRCWRGLPREEPDEPLTASLPEAPPPSRCRRWSKLFYECGHDMARHDPEDIDDRGPLKKLADALTGRNNEEEVP